MLQVVWQEVQANTSLSPESKRIVLITLDGMWKQWKHFVKTDYFLPHENDDEYLLQLPDERLELDQWRSLVHYWKNEEVKNRAIRNSESRGQKKHPHRTGRTAFSILIDEMEKNGIDVYPLEVWVASRTCGNGVGDEETAELVCQLKEHLESLPESEKTEELKAEFFANAFGPEAHGCVRCLGKGITLTQIRATASITKNVQDKFMKLREEVFEEKERISQEIEQLSRMKEEIATEREFMKQELAEERALMKDEREHMRQQLKKMEYRMSLMDPIQAMLHTTQFSQPEPAAFAKLQVMAGGGPAAVMQN